MVAQVVEDHARSSNSFGPGSCRAILVGFIVAPYPAAIRRLWQRAERLLEFPEKV
jgi:hypothetical protein